MEKRKFGYKGEYNDNYRANAYALKCMFVAFAVLTLSWILDLLGIFIVELKIMHIATGSAAVICLISVGYAFLVGIDSKSSCYVIMFLLVAMATVICTELAYHTTMFILFPLVCSAQYFDKKISWFTAIATCAGCAVAVMVGYEIGLCDSNMLLLTRTYSSIHIAELTSGEFEINNDKSLMFLFFVFPKWLIVCALMPLLNHVARDIQEHTAREAMARHLAEVDGLTGIYNRTKYLQNISNYYPTCDQVAVFFFDVNNLKKTNDTMGHEYGDILICGLSEALQERSTNTCKCYRIGGDEFVMILEKGDVQNAQKFYEDIETNVHGKHLDGGINLSVAVGLAIGKGKNIEALVKEADEKMYANKVAMKKLQQQ